MKCRGRKTSQNWQVSYESEIKKNKKNLNSMQKLEMKLCTWTGVGVTDNC